MMRTPANTPDRDEEGTASQWRRIIGWLVFAAAGIVALDLFLTMKFMRGPDEQPTTGARPVVASAEVPHAVTVAVPSASAEAAPLAATTGTLAAASVPTAMTPASTNSEPPELRERHLAAQAESLRKECEERANDDSLLTPSKEDAERLIREGRVIY